MAATSPSRTFVLSSPVAGEDVREFQKDLNQRFASWEIARRVDTDGFYGSDTQRATVQVCTGLGIEPDGVSTQGVTPALRIKIRHPERRTPQEIERSKAPAAVAFRERLRKQSQTGVVIFDGHPVAAWIVPSLQFARAHGWTGAVISGVRTCEQQKAAAQQLAERLHTTVAAIYPNGPCASNHVGSEFPKGAVDVTNPVQLAQVLVRCPHTPKLVASKVAGDPNHFSANGH